MPQKARKGFDEITVRDCLFTPHTRTVWVEKRHHEVRKMKRTAEQRLEHIIYRMQTDDSIDAPADALAYAKNLYRTRMTAPAKSVVERILAVLRVDLAPNRAAFGERSGGGEARQMLFDSGETAIDLRIMQSGSHFDIRGQVLGLGFEKGEVEVLGQKTPVRAEISGTSQFEIGGLTPGEYTMAIRSGDKEIFIEQLKLN